MARESLVDLGVVEESRDIQAWVASAPRAPPDKAAAVLDAVLWVEGMLTVTKRELCRLPRRWLDDPRRVHDRLFI